MDPPVTSEWAAIGVSLAAGIGIGLAALVEAWLRQIDWKIEWLEGEVERLERLVRDRNGWR